MGLVEELIGHVSAKSIAVFVAASCTIYIVLVNVDRRRRRRRLGARPPKAKYWIPFGEISTLSYTDNAGTKTTKKRIIIK